MESIFLRIDSGDGIARIYPLSAFGYLTHNPRGHLHIVIGDRVWFLADCRPAEMVVALEDAILQEIAATIWAYRDLSPYQGPSACIIDLNEIAEGNLAGLQRDEAEARELAQVDAMLAAGEQDQETGYDGVRSDHSIADCRGRGA